MTKLTILNQGAGSFVVKGDLTFATISTKTLKLFDFSGISKQITIDLSGVNSTDSAGLALMIEWIKYARHHRVHIVFKKIPDQLHNLAKLSGLDNTAHFIEHPSEGAHYESLPNIDII